jgi:predicted DsbA family dithiol-disulfide isomerase
MRREPKTLIPYTRPAQAATIFAAETASPETVDLFHRRAYQAYWEDIENLGDLAVLERLMIGCGLDWQTFLPRLETGLYDGQMQLEHNEAMMIGLNGVPSFVIDGKLGIVGAQPIEIFTQAIERAITMRGGAG